MQSVQCISGSITCAESYCKYESKVQFITIIKKLNIVSGSNWMLCWDGFKSLHNMEMVWLEKAPLAGIWQMLLIKGGIVYTFISSDRGVINKRNVKRNNGNLQSRLSKLAIQLVCNSNNYPSNHYCVSCIIQLLIKGCRFIGGQEQTNKHIF